MRPPAKQAENDHRLHDRNRSSGVASMRPPAKQAENKCLVVKTRPGAMGLQ